MSRRSPPLTEKEVWDAAETLEEEGAPVSQQSVLHFIGHGSITTIAKYLTTWREHNHMASEIKSLNLPTKPPDYVAAAFMEMWRTAEEEARKQAEKALDNERQAVETLRQKTQRELEDFRAENRTLERLRENAQNELEALKERHQKLVTEYDETNTRLQNEIDALKNHLSETEKTLSVESQKNRDLAQRIEDAQSNLDRVRQDHREQLKTEQARTDAIEKRLVEQLEEQRKLAAQHRAEASKRENEAHKAQERADQAQSRADNALTRADQANEMVAKLQNDLRQAENRTNEVRSQVTSLESELADSEKERKALDERNEVLETDLNEHQQAMVGLIDPAPLLDWIEGGMKTPAKSFHDATMREIARSIEYICHRKMK